MTGLAHAIIALVALQRLAEMAHARRNTARLRAAGAVEAGARHYPLIVGLHAAWLAALALTVPLDAAIQWPWLVAFAALQAARVWTIGSLGRFWTTRVLVMPGVTPVRRGPYRWLRHPNYVVVALEIPMLPLALGAEAVALGFGAANLAVLAWRIRVEDDARASMSAREPAGSGKSEDNGAAGRT
mgnify:CR=1 FL=1